MEDQKVKKLAGILAIIALFILALPVALVLTSCATKEALIPNQRNFYSYGYIGPVVVIYEREGYPPLSAVSEEDETLLLNFDEQGLVITSSKRPMSPSFSNLVSHFWKNEDAESYLLQGNPKDSIASISPPINGMIVSSGGITTISALNSCTYTTNRIYEMAKRKDIEQKEADNQAAEALALTHCNQTKPVPKKE